MPDDNKVSLSGRTMWLVVVLGLHHLVSIALSQTPTECLNSPTYRRADNSDIDVTCGIERIDISILLCPIYYYGYNTSMLALNGRHELLECRGQADWSANPPVLKMNFSLTESAINMCSNNMTLIDGVGTGVFSDYSVVQFVNISGMLCSREPSSLTISYREDLMYRFSCHYPLQYLIQNASLSVTGNSVAVKDKNGSFISTLRMSIYSDSSYTNLLQIPPEGVQLKTRVFIEVKANKLTNSFNVLLDRCYTTPTPSAFDSVFYDLFVGCTKDGQTVMGINGMQQQARFSFETFRFVQQRNYSISTFFLHCATRLCVASACPTFIKNCTINLNYNAGRRRRGASTHPDMSVTDEAMVNSGPIKIQADSGEASKSEVSQRPAESSILLAISTVAAIVAVTCVGLGAFIAYNCYANRISKTFCSM